MVSLCVHINVRVYVSVCVPVSNRVYVTFRARQTERERELQMARKLFDKSLSR